jgi:hypothetical protein
VGDGAVVVLVDLDGKYKAAAGHGEARGARSGAGRRSREGHMVTMTRAKVAIALGAFVLAAMGCNAVLGIETASVDPALSGGNADSGGGGGDAGTKCEQYCSIIQTNCIGDNLEYLDMPTCLAMCQHLEPGATTDTQQDSLGCRTYHANNAATDPGFHCRHAGPLGGNQCGDDPCSPFCLLDFAECGDLPNPPYDGGESGCRAACRANLTYLTADAGDNTIRGGGGNSLNCRLYHLESAYSQDKVTHCPHTAIVSATCN